jgi:hypothetical protein
MRHWSSLPCDTVASENLQRVDLPLVNLHFLRAGNLTPKALRFVKLLSLFSLSLQPPIVQCNES